MMYLTPIPKQFLDESGIPYSGGAVSVYVRGTTDFAKIYDSSVGQELHVNPAVLDSNGAWKCYVPIDQPYDYIVKDKEGNVVAFYEDVLPWSAETFYNVWIKPYMDDNERLTLTTQAVNNVGYFPADSEFNDTMYLFPACEDNVELSDERLTINEY